MLKIHEIREIIKLMDQSQLQEFEVKTDETRISLKKNSSNHKGAVVAAVPSVQPVTPLAAVALHHLIQFRLVRIDTSESRLI